MLIPLTTDASLFYRPWGTIGLIIANVFAFAFMMAGHIGDDWTLQYGNGLHPLEWVLSVFVHADIGHLLGNMLFLWVFGHLVEGKLGNEKFVVLYLLLAVVGGAIEQTLMLGYGGAAPGSCGASGVISALMAIALIWAPENCIQMVWFFMLGPFIRIHHFDVRIWVYSLFWIGLQVLMVVIAGSGAGSSLLHLLGAATGVPVAIWLLRKQWVDCEDWDIFSVWQGKHQRGLEKIDAKFQNLNSDIKRTPAANAIENNTARKKESPRKILARLNTLLDEDRITSAWNLYQLHRDNERCQLDAQPLGKLADGLVRLRDWKPAAAILQELIDRFGDNKGTAGIALAGILTRELQRPTAALRYLDALAEVSLSPNLQQTADRVRVAAERMVADGVVELSGF